MPQPAASDLQQFMAAIRQVESGGEDDPYRARGPRAHSKWGRAQGAYQIMSEIWPSWAAEAGYGGLTESQFLNSPKVQDAIAANKMSQYYDRYDGNWALVAAAWFSGIGGADRAQAQGLTSVADLNDGGINVPTYVKRVMNNMGQASSVDPAQFPEEDRAGAQAAANAVQGNVDVAATRSPQRNTVQAVMNRLSQQVQRNPGNAETHQAVRQAMQQFMGADPGPKATPVQAARQSPAEPAPEPEQESMTDGVPTQAPGTGQQGVI